MGEAFWAAREGDALLHSSFAADFLSGALEIAANMAIMAAAAAVVVYGGAIIGAAIAGTSAVAAVGAVASVGVSATLGCGGMFAVGAITGAIMSVSGLSEAITKYADKFANWVFPPTIQGYIISGSADTNTNSKPSARAAATAFPRQILEELEKQAKEKKEKDEEEKKKRREAQSISDIAGEYFEGAKNAAKGLAQKMSTLEGAKELGMGVLEGTGHFISEMWQPTVAQAAPGSEPKDKDKIDCHKHPSSISDVVRQKAERGLLSGILDAINPLGALEGAFQAVNGLIGSIKGWCGKDSAEYLAEGARDVRINSQPAARSNARTTCEAKVVEEPEDGTHVSKDVRIGGPLLVVRDIKSGKSQIVLVAGLVMAFMGPGKFSSKLACFLLGLGTDLLVQKAVNAVKPPVNAATGAKYLAGPEDLDFILPGHFPIDWQRTYSSRDERTEGIFGAGWSVPYEVSLEKTPDNLDENCWTFISTLGRRLDMQAVAPGQGFHSAGEGLAVRRSEEGLWLITSDGGTHYLFEPDPHHPNRQRLHQMGDRHQHILTLHYDQVGRLRVLIDEEQRNGLILYYEHPEHTRRVTRLERKLPDGTHETLMHYRFNERGELTEVRNSEDQLLRQFAYDEHHNMTLHRLPQGDTCHYRWAWFEGPDDKAWRVVEHWTDSGEHYHLDYHLPERQLRVTDSLGRSRTHQWNAQGQITRYQDELGQTSTFEWSEERQLLTKTNAAGGTWRYVYDRQGHLTETHDPLGQVDQTQWHEAWHEPLVETDPAGNTWRHLYDERGNRVASIDPHQQRTLYHYDGHGLITQIVDARGGHKHLRWNEDGQLIRHTDCSSSETAFQYDARGQLTRITNAAGEQTAYHYNSLGQLTGTTTPDGRQERYQLDAIGQLTGLTDPAGGTTRYQRNARGLVTARTDAAGRTLGFDYDAYGRLTALINENGERYQFHYDAKDRLTEQTDLDGRRQQLTYDALDHIIAVHYAAGTPSEIEHRFERDALSRLIRKITPDTDTTYRYNKISNLLEISSKKHKQPDEEAERITFTWDKLNQLLTEATAQGTLTHQYDVLGNRTSTTFPDGRTINHLYYGSGHLHQINLDGHTITDIERDRLHREILRSQGQLDTRRFFDNAGRTHRLQTYRGKTGIVPNTLIDRHYQYDSLDQLTGKRHTRQGRTDYRYDPTGRATGCRNEAYWDTLQYDAAANLLDSNTSPTHTQQINEQGHATHSGNVIRFNRVLKYQRHHYHYDEHGRTQSKRSPEGTQHYTYDAHHRLTEVHIHQGEQTRRYGYVYDALGRRIEKHQLDLEGKPYNRTKFLWDGMRMVSETRPGGSHSLYLYSDQGSYEPLARIDKRSKTEQNGNVLYYHTDLNGVPEELTDEKGEIVWEASYQLWGNTVKEVYTETQTNSVEQNLRYQGQYLDRETGLHYNTFRYYDPDIGRFTTPDPIGLLGGLNLYAYAPNALSWIDPWGWANSNTIGVYDVHAESRLPQDMYRMSDGKHFQEANRQLYYQMKNDPQFRAALESKYPGIFAEVSPGKRGAFPRTAPTNTTWHHHEQVGGLLQLVDQADHNFRHKDYHPSGKGGRNKWGGGTECR